MTERDRGIISVDNKKKSRERYDIEGEYRYSIKMWIENGRKRDGVEKDDGGGLWACMRCGMCVV